MNSLEKRISSKSRLRTWRPKTNTRSAVFKPRYSMEKEEVSDTITTS